MPKNATTADAQVILQIYDLRREAEMRKSREWFANFWPQNADEVLKVITTFPSRENTAMRQVVSYWEMAAAIALHGAVNAELFLEPGASGEMMFFLAKLYPYLKEIREKMQAPEFFISCEKLIMNSKKGRERFQRMRDRVEARRKAATGKA
jgi:preprotein translocase subunit SecE